MARQYKGGYYKMDHQSFGAMMVSEQVRRPLDIVSGLIRARAAANSRTHTRKTPRRPGDGPSLALQYRVEKGPLVTLIVDGKPSPRISNRVVNRARHAAAREFGLGGVERGVGTRDLRRAGEAFGSLSKDIA